MSESIEITINQGKLRGRVASDIFGKNYYSFQGIPYAKPPVGELRFKPPVEPEKWSGIFDARNEGSASLSRDVFGNSNIIGDENCLILNVFTKNLSKKRSLPVLFWIHGGGFMWWSSSTTWFGPDFLITEDVVVVSINYRLGLLGFLGLKNPSAGVPGNNGLKDMVAALKWVQNNISHFGGDPENVTIFGESAGAAAVHLLILSPKTNGLFHKAIAQSGSALNYWVPGRHTGDEIASVIGLEGADDKTVLEYLLQQPQQKIFEIQEKIYDVVNEKGGRPFSFVVEYDNPDAFLSEEPIKVISEGRYNHVPFIIGYTSAEGMFFDFLKVDSWETKILRTFNLQRESKELKTVVQKINNFFYGDEKPSLSNEIARHNINTDTSFLFDMYLAIKAQVLTSKAPIYFYRFSIDSTLNYMKRKIGTEAPGVSHCDDLGYLFKTVLTPDIKSGSPEDVGWRRFVKLWVNLARYGNPTPDANDSLLNVTWKPVNKTVFNFLEIGEKLTVGVDPDSDRILFWKNLFLDSPASARTEFAFLK